MIEFRDVDYSIDGRPILKGITLAVRAGETRVILGPSGSGKSTTLRLLIGLVKPDRGSIFIDGEDITRISEERLRQIRHGIGMVFQQGALFDSMTVGENVGYALLEQNDDEADVEARVREVLRRVGLDDELIDRMPDEMSGGMQRRVAIGRALAARDPKILLYDEPTTGLDPITALTVDEEIIKLRDLEGVSSVLVTHQLRDAFFVAEHAASRETHDVSFEKAPKEKTDQAEFIMLKDGGILFEGSATELRDAAKDDAYIRSFLS
jgi:phospholipid/cholesterol/gamma-HCH transport system ATP-binding protein